LSSFDHGMLLTLSTCIFHEAIVLPFYRGGKSPNFKHLRPPCAC
jgi:hypothetical protein